MLKKLCEGILKMGRLPNRRKRIQYALKACLQDPTLYPLRTFPRFDVDACTAAFVRNHELLHTYLSERGTKVLTYLEPANGLGSRGMSESDIANLGYLRRRKTVHGMSQTHALEAFYGRIRAWLASARRANWSDLSGVFDHVPAPVYLDQIHVSDLGCDIIAKRISADVLRLEYGGRREGFTPTSG